MSKCKGSLQRCNLERYSCSKGDPVVQTAVVQNCSKGFLGCLLFLLGVRWLTHSHRWLFRNMLNWISCWNRCSLSLVSVVLNPQIWDRFVVVNRVWWEMVLLVQLLIICLSKALCVLLHGVWCLLYPFWTLTVVCCTSFYFRCFSSAFRIASSIPSLPKNQRILHQIRCHKQTNNLTVAVASTYCIGLKVCDLVILYFFFPWKFSNILLLESWFLQLSVRYSCQSTFIE